MQKIPRQASATIVSNIQPNMHMREGVQSEWMRTGTGWSEWRSETNFWTNVNRGDGWAFVVTKTKPQPWVGATSIVGPKVV